LQYNIREENIKSQVDFKILRNKVAREANLKNVNQEIELKQIEESTYCNIYNGMWLNNTDRVKNSWRANHDIVPYLVSDAYTLKL